MSRPIIMPDAPLMGLKLEPGDLTPLFAQIYEALRRRIICGQLEAGQRLAASRNLAQELGVSRSTVVVAYDQLIAEGFAQGRRGAGIFVSDIGAVEMDQGPIGLDDFEAARSDFPNTQQVQGSPRAFQPGRPDMRLFPYRQWARCFARVARTDPQALVLGTDPFGDGRLRTAIARYLADWRGLNVSAQQVLITAGSVDALEICLRTLVKLGAQTRNCIALEDPGYAPIRDLVDSLGLGTHWLDIDDSGACLPGEDADGSAPMMAVLTPSSQFPLGGAMPTRRRLAFLNWAQTHNAWIVEDDYDSEFRYAGRPIPALASYDQSGRTLYIGSFSKVFADALRLGFVVIPRDLVDRFSKSLRTHGTKASITPQRALALFMEDGEFYRHIRRMRRLYGERRLALMGFVRERLGHLVTFEDHHAGMQIVLHLAQGLDDVEIARRAARRGVVCGTLSTYCARPANSGAKLQGLILGFCGFSVAELEDAINILGDVLEN